MAAKIKRCEHKISADQIAALYYLTNGNNKMDLEFTWSESGGHHLYVKAGGVNYHLSRTGNLVKLSGA